jgi:hypothetical protein
VQPLNFSLSQASPFLLCSIAPLLLLLSCLRFPLCHPQNQHHQNGGASRPEQMNKPAFVSSFTKFGLYNASPLRVRLGIEPPPSPLYFPPLPALSRGQNRRNLGEQCGRTNPLELFRFKCAHHYTGDNGSTHFKWNNPLVCRVTARFNHSYTGSR